MNKYLGCTYLIPVLHFLRYYEINIYQRLVKSIMCTKKWDYKEKALKCDVQIGRPPKGIYISIGWKTSQTT